MSHAMRLKAINTIMGEGRVASVVLIDLPTNIRSIVYSPAWGNFQTLTRMGDSLVSDCEEAVFVEARASQHHTQLLIMTTINTDYNTELLDQELNFDELQEINGAVAPLVVAGIAGAAAFVGFVTGVAVRHYCS